MQPKPRRPGGVTILSVSAILGSVPLLFAGAALELGVGGSSSGISPIGGAILIIAFVFGYAGVLFATTSSFVLTMMMLINAILYLSAGIGSFGGRRWAWTLGVALSLIGIVLNIIQIVVVTGYFYGQPGLFVGLLYYSLPGLFITLVIFYYLTRSYVRNFFGK